MAHTITSKLARLPGDALRPTIPQFQPITVQRPEFHAILDEWEDSELPPLSSDMGLEPTAWGEY